jgi:DNA-binding LacI/PurR family transcriptional regulator
MAASSESSDSHRRPTMADVAWIARVPATTVSFVINNRTDQSRRNVLAAVQELGHRPNRAARNLQAQHTATIGFVNHEAADNPYGG